MSRWHGKRKRGKAVPAQGQRYSQRLLDKQIPPLPWELIEQIVLYSVEDDFEMMLTWRKVCPATRDIVLHRMDRYAKHGVQRSITPKVLWFWVARILVEKNIEADHEGHLDWYRRYRNMLRDERFVMYSEDAESLLYVQYFIQRVLDAPVKKCHLLAVTNVKDGEFVHEMRVVAPGNRQEPPMVDIFNSTMLKFLPQVPRRFTIRHQAIVARKKQR